MSFSMEQSNTSINNCTIHFKLSLDADSLYSADTLGYIFIQRPPTPPPPPPPSPPSLLLSLPQQQQQLTMPLVVNCVTTPTGAMKNFPENPKNWNPTQLVNQMKPGVQFIETIISLNTPLIFQVNCVIDDVPFTGQGSTKKAAKKECCIAAIKYFWQFDFHAIENMVYNSTTTLKIGGEMYSGNHISKTQAEQKTGAMKNFPENPKNWNPIQLVNQMKPGVQFIETIISLNTPLIFQVNCVIDDVPFTGQGSSKKAAKKECCIAAIKYFWQFDFHAIENN